MVNIFLDSYQILIPLNVSVFLCVKVSQKITLIYPKKPHYKKRKKKYALPNTEIYHSHFQFLKDR